MTVDREKTVTSGLIGYLDDTRGDDMYTSILEGMLEVASREGFRVVRFGYTPNATDEATGYARLFSLIRASCLDGLIFLGWTRAGAMYNRESLFRQMAGVRLLSLGSEYPDIPSVLYRGDAHIAEMVRHLITRHGHRRIAYLPPPRADTRMDAWRAVMREHGLVFPEMEIAEEEWGVTGSVNRAKRFLELLLDERKVALDAIVSSGHIETEVLARELARRNLRIPEDIALTGYVDTEFERYATPGITTIDYPWSDMGRVACSKMVDWIRTGERPESVLLPGRVLIRESCGCVSELVHQAAVGLVPPETERLGTLTAQQRQALLRPLNEAFPYPSLSFDALLDALLHDMSHPLASAPDGEQDPATAQPPPVEPAGQGGFLEELSAQLAQSPPAIRQARLETLVLQFRSTLMPWLMKDKQAIRTTGELFRRAQSLLLSEIAHSRGHAGIQAKNQLQSMQETAQALMTVHSRQGIQDALFDNLPKLHIPFCALVLFPNGRSNAAQESDANAAISQTGECMLLDIRHRKVEHHHNLTADQVMALAFSTHVERRVLQILPLELSSKYEVFAGPGLQRNNERREAWDGQEAPTGTPAPRRGAFSLPELMVEANWLGYVLFEPGPADEQIYRAIASHLCSALENTAMAEVLQTNYMRLMEQAFAEGLSDVVSHVMHHAGNAFNSVHASAQVLSRERSRNPIPDLLRAESLLAALFQTGMPKEPESAARTVHLLELFQLLGRRAVQHRDAMGTHLTRILDKSRWMDDIITLQQDYAVAARVEELVPLQHVLDDALRVHAGSYTRGDFAVDKALLSAAALRVPRWKTFVVLVFLLARLVESITVDAPADPGSASSGGVRRELRIRLDREGPSFGLRFTVTGVDLRQMLVGTMLQAQLLFEAESSGGTVSCIMILPNGDVETEDRT